MRIRILTCLLIPFFLLSACGIHSKEEKKVADELSIDACTPIVIDIRRLENANVGCRDAEVWAERIRRQMKENGLTLSDLGYSSDALDAIVGEKYVAAAEMLHKLAAGYETTARFVHAEGRHVQESSWVVYRDRTDVKFEYDLDLKRQGSFVDYYHDPDIRLANFFEKTPSLDNVLKIAGELERAVGKRRTDWNRILRSLPTKERDRAGIMSLVNQYALKRGFGERIRLNLLEGSPTSSQVDEIEREILEAVQTKVVTPREIGLRDMNEFDAIVRDARAKASKP